MSVAAGMAELPPHVRDLVDSSYLHGYAAGLEAGRAQQEAAERSWWEKMTSQVVALGTSPSAAVLADLRGQHDRADAIRSDHVRRGVAW